MNDLDRNVIARGITDSQRVLIQEKLALARRTFYSIKARYDEVMRGIEAHSSPHGREMAFKFAGDHILALPDEFKALEEALDAVALGFTDMEQKRLKEKLPGRAVDEFVDATDTRL